MNETASAQYDRENVVQFTQFKSNTLDFFGIYHAITVVLGGNYKHEQDPASYLQDLEPENKLKQKPNVCDKIWYNLSWKFLQYLK